MQAKRPMDGGARFSREHVSAPPSVRCMRERNEEGAAHFWTAPGSFGSLAPYFGGRALRTFFFFIRFFGSSTGAIGATATGAMLTAAAAAGATIGA